MNSEKTSQESEKTSQKSEKAKESIDVKQSESINPEEAKKVKRIILKNLFIIGFGWVFLFTAYSSIANLQSSLNSDDGLGTVSLSTIYVSLILSCIFLPTILIKKLGVKWTIFFSQLAYVLYIGANIFPRYYTLVPGAIILGRKFLFKKNSYILNDSF